MENSKAPVVFFSWQSDLPSKTNRGLIRDALERACKDLSADLEDAPRVDSDTQGVSGSPDIASTIFSKIDAADVFVADVSIIGAVPGSGERERPVPNPNVMIELGYAKRALGLERVLMVCNTAFGVVEQLPFDLRMKRVQTYSCSGDAEPAVGRNELRDYFKMAIRSALESKSMPTESEQDALKRRLQRFEEWRQTRRSELIARSTPVKLQEGVTFAVQVAAARSLDDSVKIDAIDAISTRVVSEIGALVGVGSFSSMPDVDSCTVFPGGDHTLEVPHFDRLFNNGIVEDANTFWKGPNPVLNSLVCVLEAAHRLVGVLKKLELAGPYFISLDVLGVKGGTFSTQGHYVFPDRGRAISLERLTPDVIVLEDGGDVRAALVPALDYCWRAAGFKNCFACR